MIDNTPYKKRLAMAPVNKERIADICGQISLTDPIAIGALKVCLQHIEADLTDYCRKAYAPDERSDIIDRRRKLLAAIDRLERTLDENADLLKEVLPKGTLEETGLLLAPETIKDALGQKTPRYLNLSDRDSVHRAVGIEHGNLLIQHIVHRLSQPLRDWMAANNQNLGGRPPDIRRRHVIQQLAHASPEIIGRAPTASTNSPFVRLCVAVFQAFELPDEGIEDAIERELRDLAPINWEKTDAD